MVDTIMLVTDFRLYYTGLWWWPIWYVGPNIYILIGPSPTSQSDHQLISSRTSITNIDVVNLIRPHSNRQWYSQYSEKFTSLELDSYNLKNEF